MSWRNEQNARLFCDKSVEITMLEADIPSPDQTAALLRAIVESLPFRMYAIDASGRVILQNSASIHDFGNLVGTIPQKGHVSQAEWDRWEANIRRALGGEVVWDETRIELPGGPRHYRFVAAPIRDAAAIRGTVGVDIDITEEVQTKQSLRESEALYRLLAENSSDVISRHKPSGEWLFLSPAVRGLMGLEPDDLVGRDPFDFIHPDDQAQVQQALAALITSRESQSATFRIRRADGSYIWSETVGRAVVDPATGELRELVTTSRDVTERIEASRKLRTREAELAHAGRLSTMGQMATEIAHELNQPLYAIANFADACLTLVHQKAEPPDANLVHWLELIAQQARRAGEVLRRITQFVRKGEVNPVPLHLNDLIRDVLNLLDYEIRQQQVTVRLALSESLSTVMADRLLIEQVLANLVRNAVEALAMRASEMREIRVATRAEQGGAIASVNDTGPGLTETQLSRAFEPYFTTKDHGTGLGLAICRSTIEAHGGKIWAHNNESGGATFEFLLPTAREAGEKSA